MERSEPALVPEWLKNAGNPNNAGASIVSRPDDREASKLARNKSFVNTNNDHEPGRSFSSDRATSSYLRRNEPQSFHPSFGRNTYDRVSDTFDFRDKEKPVSENSLRRYDSDGLRHSHSAGYGKPASTWHKRANGNNTDGLLTTIGPKGKNIMFQRDFPSLRVEDRGVNSDAGIVCSPGLCSSVTSGGKWTSALAEVSVGLGSSTCLNMAEAVVQGSSRARSTTQLYTGTRRREELALKQCRQLIPVKPKTLVSNSSDKPRNEVGQQQPASSMVAVNHSQRGGPALNMGKLHVLKLKNGATPTAKDSLNPTSSTVSNPPVATKGQVIPDCKPLPTVVEKKPASHVRSRNDFFNSVRKQSMTNSSAVAVSPQVDDALSDLSLSGADHLSEAKGDQLKCNVDAQKHVSNGKRHYNCDLVFSEEEEAAFLRSLGWEENAEEGGLTDEEIRAFFRDVSKYINSKPCLKILQVQLFPLLETQIGVIPSGLSSSEAKLES